MGCPLLLSQAGSRSRASGTCSCIHVGCQHHRSRLSVKYHDTSPQEVLLNPSTPLDVFISYFKTPGRMFCLGITDQQFTKPRSRVIRGVDQGLSQQRLCLLHRYIRHISAHGTGLGGLSSLLAALFSFPSACTEVESDGHLVLKSHQIQGPEMVRGSVLEMRSLEPRGVRRLG